jgi:hypothetical protein
MKRKILLVFAICAIAVMNVKAQDEGEKKGGFKKENLFTGGNVALGFGSGTTSFGLGPYFGYSINKYLDAAIGVNYNYVSQRDNVEYGDKLRQSIIAPTAFIRVFPVKFLFAQAQFEQNFVKLKYIPAENGSYLPGSQRYNVSSFLIGPGFAGGRGEDEGNAFYYISVLFDVAKNTNSPYVDDLGRVTPIIRAGYNIALFQGTSSKNRYRKRNIDQ